MITKDELKNFRSDFDKAITELEKKYNITISQGSISYSENEFHMKITAKKNTTTSGKSTEQADFEKYCELFGLKPSDYGKTFKSNGKEFMITGLNVRARSMPVIAYCSDGKSYKFSEESIKRVLK
jgi:hypothetical protein